MTGRRRRHRRRCSSATRVTLVTAGCNAVKGTAAAVKILMRMISERGSNPCAKYHFKHWIELESCSNGYKRPSKTLPLKNPPITMTNHHQSGNHVGTR